MAWADGIQVRWQSTDTEVLEIMSSTSKAGSSSSTSTAASRAAPTIAPNTSTPSPASQASIAPSPTSQESTTPSQTQPKQIPTVAPDTGSVSKTVALSVSLSIAAIIFLAAFVFLWRRWRRHKRKSSTLEGGISELDARFNERPIKGELDGPGRVELTSEKEPVELTAGKEPVELP